MTPPLVLALLFALCSCAPSGQHGGWMPSAGSSGDGRSRLVNEPEAAGMPPSAERTTVRAGRDGQTVTTRRPGETTIVRPGGVTVIQRDRDGTRTIVDTDRGVRVDLPGDRRRRR